MAIVTTWDDREKTRIHIEFETSWSWDELKDALRTVDAYLASVVHSVDIIVDFEGSTLPRDFMQAARGLLENPTPRTNEGYRIVVGANNTIRRAYQTLHNAFGDRLVGREVLWAEDLSQARAILHSMRLEADE